MAAAYIGGSMRPRKERMLATDLKVMQGEMQKSAACGYARVCGLYFEGRMSPLFVIALNAARRSKR
jgi:hypothetical protein